MSDVTLNWKDRERLRDSSRKMLIHALHEVETGTPEAAAGFVVAALGNLGALLGPRGCDELGKRIGDAVLATRAAANNDQAGPEPAEGDPTP